MRIYIHIKTMEKYNSTMYLLNKISNKKLLSSIIAFIMNSTNVLGPRLKILVLQKNYLFGIRNKLTNLSTQYCIVMVPR